MDVSTPCDDLAREYVNSALDSIHAHVNHKECMCSKSLTSEDNAVAEFELLHIQELKSGCTLAINEEGIYLPKKESPREELKTNQINSSTAASEKVLAKCATFPQSRKLAFPVTTIGNDEISDMACDGLCSMKSDKPACTRSISLPTSMKLVSAMKGSRERHGTDEKILTVTWAPDVYDPPVTSVSHAVKSYSQQRSRTNKKNNKNKHKGKSSRGSSEKKIRKQSGNSEPWSMNQAASNDLFHQSTVDFLDVSVTGQESNCGSSFLKTSVGKVHISFAEAT